MRKRQIDRFEPQATGECIARGRPITHAMVEGARAPLPGSLRAQQALTYGIEAAQGLSFVPGVGTGVSAAIGAALVLANRDTKKGGRR